MTPVNDNWNNFALLKTDANEKQLYWESPGKKKTKKKKKKKQL
jgi:ribosomal protein S11